MVEVMNACKSRGLWPFSHFNRIHMAPPLIVSEDEVGRALAILDDALTVAVIGGSGFLLPRRT